MGGVYINGNGQAFDQDSGEWLGVADNKGKFQPVMNAAQAAAITSSVVDASGNVLASGGALGPYADLAALAAAKPAASNSGKTAMVGAAAPYNTLSSNGADWLIVTDTAPNVLTTAQASMRKWQAARGNVLSGVSGEYLLALVGDSTSIANSTTRKAVGNLLAVQLNAHGTPAHDNFWTVNNADSRVTVGAGIVTNFENWDMSAAVAALSVTPDIQCDKFVVTYWQNSAGTFGWALDGGGVTNVVASGSGGLASVTITAGSVGTHTLALTKVSGAPWIKSIRAWNSASPAVTVCNLAVSGSSTTTWIFSAGNTWNHASLSTHIAAKQYIVNLGINDLNNTVPAATYKSNLASLVTQYTTLGGLSFARPTPISPQTTAVQTSYYQNLVDTCNANGIAWLDLYGRRKDYASSLAGGMQADTLHPTPAGYGDIAAAWSGMLTA